MPDQFFSNWYFWTLYNPLCPGKPLALLFFDFTHFRKWQAVQYDALSSYFVLLRCHPSYKNLPGTNESEGLPIFVATDQSGKQDNYPVFALQSTILVTSFLVFPWVHFVHILHIYLSMINLSLGERWRCLGLSVNWWWWIYHRNKNTPPNWE